MSFEQLLNMRQGPKLDMKVATVEDMRLLLTQKQTSGTEVLDSAVAHNPYAEFGHREKEEFLAHFFHGIIKEPEKAHLFFVASQPDKGKTTFNQQTIVKLLSLLGTFFKENGYELKLSIMPWGDGYPLPKGVGVPDQVKYHKRAIQRMKKREEARMAATRYEKSLLSSLPDRDTSTAKEVVMQEGTEHTVSPKKEIHVIVGGLPFGSSDNVSVVGDRRFHRRKKPIGIPRAEQLLRKLASRTGEFANKDYTVHTAALVASPVVQERAFNNRAALVEARIQGSKKLHKEFTQRHKYKGKITDDGIERYLDEVAPPDAVNNFRRDVYEVLEAHNSSVSRSPLKDQSGLLVNTKLLDADPNLEERLTGQLYAKLLQELGFSSDNVIVLYNRDVQEKASMHPDLEIEKPLLGFKAPNEKQRRIVVKKEK